MRANVSYVLFKSLRDQPNGKEIPGACNVALVRGLEMSERSREDCGFS
jgi:hypothetical protein